MVPGEDDGAVGRHVVESHHLHAPKERGHHQVDEPREYPIGWPGRAHHCGHYHPEHAPLPAAQPLRLRTMPLEPGETLYMIGWHYDATHRTRRHIVRRAGHASHDRAVRAGASGSECGPGQPSHRAPARGRTRHRHVQPSPGRRARLHRHRRPVRRVRRRGHPAGACRHASGRRASRGGADCAYSARGERRTTGHRYSAPRPGRVRGDVSGHRDAGPGEDGCQGDATHAGRRRRERGTGGAAGDQPGVRLRTRVLGPQCGRVPRRRRCMAARTGRQAHRDATD